jgi:hypothetical protein
VTDSGKHSSLSRNTSFIAQQGALLGKAPALTHHNMEQITIGNIFTAQPLGGSDYSFCGFSSLGSDQYFFTFVQKPTAKDIYLMGLYHKTFYGCNFKLVDL